MIIVLARIAASDELVTIGYSFRDAHVNEVIRQWTTEDVDRRITIVDPGFPESASRRGDFREQLVSYLNPSAKGTGLAPRVDVLRLRASTALRRLFPL